MGTNVDHINQEDTADTSEILHRTIEVNLTDENLKQSSSEV